MRGGYLESALGVQTTQTALCIGVLGGVGGVNCVLLVGVEATLQHNNKSIDDVLCTDLRNYAVVVIDYVAKLRRTGYDQYLDGSAIYS